MGQRKKKARDAKRKADLQAIQNSLEQYYSICGFVYPIDTTGGVPKDMATSVSCADPAQDIMTQVPMDPLGDAYQIIAADANGTSYQICPPVVRTEASVSYRLETEDCTTVNNTCCVQNSQ
ncbi:MAG: Bacterial type II secretion system protein G [Microgenomates bacterium OLB22]|nr:MAG: Bacterial type II secretion system protein G [Microgenomates bacterium OLB22]